MSLKQLVLGQLEKRNLLTPRGYLTIGLIIVCFLIHVASFVLTFRGFLALFGGNKLAWLLGLCSFIIQLLIALQSYFLVRNLFRRRVRWSIVHAFFLSVWFSLSIGLAYGFWWNRLEAASASKMHALDQTSLVLQQTEDALGKLSVAKAALMQAAEYSKDKAKIERAEGEGGTCEPDIGGGDGPRSDLRSEDATKFRLHAGDLNTQIQFLRDHPAIIGQSYDPSRHDEIEYEINQSLRKIRPYFRKSAYSNTAESLAGSIRIYEGEIRQDHKGNNYRCPDSTMTTLLKQALASINSVPGPEELPDLVRLQRPDLKNSIKQAYSHLWALSGVGFLPLLFAGFLDTAGLSLEGVILHLRRADKLSPTHPFVQACCNALNSEPPQIDTSKILAFGTRPVSGLDDLMTAFLTRDGKYWVLPAQTRLNEKSQHMQRILNLLRYEPCLTDQPFRKRWQKRVRHPELFVNVTRVLIYKAPRGVLPALAQLEFSQPVRLERGALDSTVAGLEEPASLTSGNGSAGGPDGTH